MKRLILIATFGVTLGAVAVLFRNSYYLMPRVSLSGNGLPVIPFGDGHHIGATKTYEVFADPPRPGEQRQGTTLLFDAKREVSPAMIQAYDGDGDRVYEWVTVFPNPRSNDFLEARLRNGQLRYTGWPAKLGRPFQDPTALAAIQAEIKTAVSLLPPKKG